MTAVLGALGEFLAWAAWVAWLLLGFARARPQAGDVVDDRGTWRWGMSVLLASVLAAVVVRAVVPAAAIPDSRGVILIVGAAVALSGVASVKPVLFPTASKPVSWDWHTERFLSVSLH